MGICPSRAAASMLETIRGQPSRTDRPSGVRSIRANSGQWCTASSSHWIEVWCSLFFFTPTRARQSRHATEVSRALV